MPPTEGHEGPGRDGGSPAPDRDELQLRVALPEDLSGVHDLYLAARAGAGHPPETRSPEEVGAWVEGLLSGGGELWLAVLDDELSGFALLHGSWLHELFVHPDRQGAGVGAALLDLVKALRPDGFGLRVFEANVTARRFYGRHGLVELERTDGSSYRDREPDLQMAWLGDDPLAYLRRRIDQVDDELAVLLARRMALTAAVQDHKWASGGDAGVRGRDPAREREIVERMAEHVPGLGADRIGHVLHTVIEESLAAWEARSGKRA